jgi:hypothetical protein
VSIAIFTCQGVVAEAGEVENACGKPRLAGLEMGFGLVGCVGGISPSRDVEMLSEILVGSVAEATRGWWLFSSCFVISAQM